MTSDYESPHLQANTWTCDGRERSAHSERGRERRWTGDRQQAGNVCLKQGTVGYKYCIKGKKKNGKTKGKLKSKEEWINEERQSGADKGRRGTRGRTKGMSG